MRDWPSCHRAPPLMVMVNGNGNGNGRRRSKKRRRGVGEDGVVLFCGNGGVVWVGCRVMGLGG